MGHFRTDRVGDAGGVDIGAKKPGGCLVDERIGDAFVVTEGCGRPPCDLFALLQRRQDRFRHARAHARHRLWLKIGQGRDPGDLFHKIGLTSDIRPPRWRQRHIAVHDETKLFQRRALDIGRDIHPDERRAPRRVETLCLAGVRQLSGSDHVRCLATTEVEHHPGCKFQPGQGKGRIDAALEPVFGVRVDFEHAGGSGNRDRIPICRLEKDVHGFLGDTGLFPTHDPGETFGRPVVGNHHHAGVERVGLFVKRQKLFAAFGAMHAQVTLHLVRIKDMERPVPVEGEKVGDIDERRNRAETNGLQALLQPRWTGAVLYTPDHATRKIWCTVERIGINRHADGRREGARHRRGRAVDLGAEAARGEVAGYTLDAQCILPVGRDRNIDDGIDLVWVVGGEPVGKALSNLTGRQFDNAVMLVRQLHLALGRHHAVALDTPNLSDLNGRVDAGNIGAGLGDDNGNPFAGIWGTADDLFDAFVGFDLADAETVGIGVFLGLENLANCEIAEFRRRIDNLFDLEPEVGQRFGDLVDRGVGVEMLFEPGQGEFHRAASGRGDTGVRLLPRGELSIITAPRGALGPATTGSRSA